MNKCSRCGTPVHDDAATVTILTARQTHWSPAEYDEVPVCDSCLEWDEYASDPYNAAYERLRAQGWAD